MGSSTTPKQTTVEQVGTVEILRARTYPLDPEAFEAQSEVIVEPGVFPLYCLNGMTYLWMMTGSLNMGGSSIQRLGDGLMILGIGDTPVDLAVTFPSRRFGEDELNALRDDDIAVEGHPQQRLRITLAP